MSIQAHPAKEPLFLTEQQVADRLCVSVRTVQKWRALGTGPDFHKFGQCVRYDATDVARWVTARRVSLLRRVS